MFKIKNAQKIKTTLQTFFAVLTLFALGGVFAAAQKKQLSQQTAKFRWRTECEHEGIYNPSKHMRTELEDTRRLYLMNGLPLGFSATVLNYGEIQNLSVDALDKEYKLKSETLKNLNVVKVPYWQQLQQRELTAMEQLYRLSRITIQAYTEPSKLKEYADAPACVATYAAPLINGGDELLAAWLRVNEDSRAKNANPARLKSIFERQSSSPDKFKFARVEVMSFGWWNCANAARLHIEDGDTRTKEFEKLFVKTRAFNCDEP